MKMKKLYKEVNERAAATMRQWHKGSWGKENGRMEGKR